MPCMYCCLQAAYLVGIADPNSEPGRPGLVDQGQFARANQAIQMACQDLTNPASSQKQVRDENKRMRILCWQDNIMYTT